MKIITFCTLGTIILSINIAFSQSETTKKEEVKPSTHPSTTNSKKEYSKTKGLASIEMNSSISINNTTKQKESKETSNTNIILTEESKDQANRTTIDFF